MKPPLRAALWVGAFFAGAVALVGAVIALLAAGLAEEDRRVMARILEGRAP
jgi:hypothetical protein